MNFTDENYKISSKAIVDAPLEVASAEGAKVEAVAGKADNKAKDDTNKLFFDNVLETIKVYHDELKNISGIIRTTYDANELDKAARLAEGNIHLGGSWTNFGPRIHASMSGNPITNTTDHEGTSITKLLSDITTLKSGFTDGAVSSTLQQAYSGSTTLAALASFPIGHRLVVFGGGRSAIVKVVSVTNVAAVAPNPAYFNHTVEVIVPPSSAISQGSTVRNFFSGFTNVERQSATNTTYPEILTRFRLNVSDAVDKIQTFLLNQKTALATNGAAGNEKIDNQGALAQADSALEFILDWETTVETGVSGRWTDTKLSNLQTMSGNRTSHIAERKLEIETALGSVSQATNGDFSGAGQYISLAKWINLRVNISSGTLRIYYDFDNILRFFDENIKMANSKKNEFEVFMLAFQFKAGSGGSVAVVNSTTGLSVGDAVKVMDDDAPITSMTIIALTPTTVTLSAPISGYSLDKVARLVKPL